MFKNQRVRASALLMALKVIDDDGNDLNTNQSGEVCIKSASTFKAIGKINRLQMTRLLQMVG